MVKLIVNDVTRVASDMTTNETGASATSGNTNRSDDALFNHNQVENQSRRATNHQVNGNNPADAEYEGLSVSVNADDQIPLEDYLNSQLSHQLFSDIIRSNYGEEQLLPVIPEVSGGILRSNRFYGDYSSNPYFRDAELPESVLESSYSASLEGFSGDVAWNTQPEMRSFPRPPVSVLGDGWNTPEPGNGRVSRRQNRTWDTLLAISSEAGSGDTPSGTVVTSPVTSGLGIRPTDTWNLPEIEYTASTSSAPEARNGYHPGTLYGTWSLPPETGREVLPREATSLSVLPETETMRVAGTLYDVWNILPETRNAFESGNEGVLYDACNILRVANGEEPFRDATRNSDSPEILPTSGAVATSAEPEDTVATSGAASPDSTLAAGSSGASPSPDSICNCSKCERVEDEVSAGGGGGFGGCCADLEVLRRLRGRRACITTSPAFREFVLSRKSLNLTRHVLACKTPDPRRRSAFTRRHPSSKFWRSIAAKQFLYWVISARNFDRRHGVKLPLCVAAAIEKKFK